MSPFIKEKKDYFVGVYDMAGRIVACHISASGPGMLTAILRTYPRETMRPGDVYWFNDPYLTDGAVQHHQDMVFVVPVFHDGQLVAFTTTFGHYQDIGGLRAGSISPHATEIYHEGVLVPARAHRARGAAQRGGLPDLPAQLAPARDGGGRHPGHDGLLPPGRAAPGRAVRPLRRPHRARRLRHLHRPDGPPRARAVPPARARRASGRSTTSSTATAAPRRARTAWS